MEKLGKKPEGNVKKKLRKPSALMCKFEETFYIHCTAPWDIMEAKRDENVNALQGHHHREARRAPIAPWILAVCSKSRNLRC